MTIGARVVKTGLAVALAVYVSTLLGFPSPIISAVAAIFTIQPSISRSWQQVVEQVQTNVLGALLALAAVRLFGQTPIALGMVCIIVILVCIRLRMESTVGLTLVTVVAVMEANNQAGWQFAVERLLMVLTGMAAAFVVNILVLPPRPRKQFIAQVHDAHDQLSLLLRMAISNEMKESVHRDEKEKLQGKLRKLDEAHRLFEEERPLMPNRKQANARQLILSRHLIKALHKGVDLLEAVEEHYFAVSGSEAWAQRFDQQIEELSKYHEHLLLKLEGKMKANAAIEPEEEREGRLIAQLSDYLHRSPEEYKRLVFVASTMLEYAYHLRRLDRVADQVQQRREAEAAEAQRPV
ncbi:FUSC family protein [Paenibacillus sp. MWE-103]|uniref:FUSC family protein n=1 Tax=Paenibacillus artemisiicola TaxID=1172618 RepID=A0ABS3WIZ7_9BACL|nr:aromatic acid exporter family protein [Paenibacillus artemisiicola]MBO7748275.1 FUSC family protein [Paenibacillus artemisiicola]